MYTEKTTDPEVSDTKPSIYVIFVIPRYPDLNKAQAPSTGWH